MFPIYISKQTTMGNKKKKKFQDSFRNVLSPRHAELALTTGRMFKTQEALQVGLIDELASDKSDAIQKAEAFLAKTSKVPPRARYLTKLSNRQKYAQKLQDKQDEDYQLTASIVLQPAVQKGLEIYLESLKQKQ